MQDTHVLHYTPNPGGRDPFTLLNGEVSQPEAPMCGQVCEGLQSDLVACRDIRHAVRFRYETKSVPVLFHM